MTIRFSMEKSKQTWYRPLKAARFHETGPADVIVIEDVPKPEAGRKQLLIRIEAAGVNYADVVRRRGDFYPTPTPLPHISGSELVGIVEDVGEGADPSFVGARVVSPSNGGSFAEYAVVPAHSAYRLPYDISPELGAALLIQGMTAAFALTENGRLKPGDSVFVQGAGGGVGLLAVQLAKLYGAGLVIAGASSEEKRAKALDMGADHAVNYTDADWPEKVRELTGGKGVDLMMEITGGPMFMQAIGAMAENGTIVVYGFASGEIVPIVPPMLMAKGLTLSTFRLPTYLANRPLMTERLDQFAGWLRSGALQVEIAGRYPLEKAADAHRALEGRSTIGKLIILPGG